MIKLTFNKRTFYWLKVERLYLLFYKKKKTFLVANIAVSPLDFSEV